MSQRILIGMSARIAADPCTPGQVSVMMPSMVEELLSQAVIAYIGEPGRMDGSPPEERVIAVVGMNTVD
jgi:hypothetical protein